MKKHPLAIALAFSIFSIAGLAADPGIREALESPIRLDADRERDNSRHPDKVLEFFQIREGMNVLDLFSGGGYYTAILSGVVGRKGNVTAHNNQAYLDWIPDELEKRYGDGGPQNVTRLTSEASAMNLGKAKFDAALAILTWHDFYYVDEQYNWPRIDVEVIIDDLCAALKPGAVLGIVDHVASPGGDVWETAQTLHRIDPARIRSDLEDSCFEFEAEADFLRNSEDDYSVSMSNEKVRGKTDRVVYRYRRQ